MSAPELLLSLLQAAGPSGHEGEPAAIWRDAASSFAEVSSDTLGNSFARVRAGGEGAPTLLVVGHIDEIGITVTNIEESGLLSFITVGGISAEALHGQRLELLTRVGRVPAAVGRKRLYPDQLRERGRLELTDLHLDIGAASREEAERLVQVGDAGVWLGLPVSLPGNRLLSKALDNRIGAYVALEAARRVAESGRAEVDVVAVAAVQEEIGSYGARPAGFGLDPQVALVVDITPSTDVPGGEPRRQGRIELGGGVMIARGPTLSPAVSSLLVEVAEKDGIPFALEAYAAVTNTDADALHLVRAGVPTGLLSVPLRNTHTPNELCALDDVEATTRLIAAFALALERDRSFVR